ncbi:phosphogluconate dehydrogenase (NAD(+)-dependent, decarboxylating) [Parvularcula dongshanensis]|uniref:6-phosphogluconate dehydrogenase n=1 Tax=Parvularcula dongshanensis TaxID=1173995 RepID=A0A840I088_9PROT|nr:decarboxylating 6-phosphogluconate dehydrogenase [Parvularcula dongshanensis]MBB4658239.1 6-phosphogluconate dehydrogenase [Parvularcula dongshanensis]
MDGSFTMIGLGRMGAGLTRRLMAAGIEVNVFDVQSEAVDALAKDGASPLSGLEAITDLPAPRTVWVMLPAGRITEDTIRQLGEMLDPGDCVIDGGNTYYKDDVRRAGELAKRSIDYVDVGVSGGVWGLREGFSLMIGGNEAQVERLDPVFAALAPGEDAAPRTEGRKAEDDRPDRGYAYCGRTGSGHFVKMVHNGIEYGLMQAYAEGFDVLRNASSSLRADDLCYDLDLAGIAEVWRRGSVIRSWLLDLNANALNADQHLESYSGHVSDSGEARWTLEAAVEEEVPVPTIAAALFARFESRRQSSFGNKLLSAMRHQFGGHIEGGGEAGPSVPAEPRD